MKLSRFFIMFLSGLIFLFSLHAHGQVITTLAGGGTTGLGDGGPATSAAFGGQVYGFTLDRKGNLLVADGWNHRVRRVDAITGVITTIAGTGIGGYNGDSIPATDAQLFGPRFLAIDTFGNLYISEFQNQRVRVVDTNGFIFTYVGTGVGAGSTGYSGAFSGDNGPATLADLNYPSGLAMDAYGNLYLSDAYNFRIRRVDALTHIISTYAGNGTSAYVGDGIAATNASLAFVYDINIDAAGNLYIADIGSAANRVRKVDGNTHIITSISGNGTALYNGDSIRADSASMVPYSVLPAGGGSFYIADYGNNRIRYVGGEFSLINTVAGTGFAGFSGDGGLPAAAQIFEPAHMLFDTCGSIYFADASNYRIRRIDYNLSCHYGLAGLEHPERASCFSLYPNPVSEWLHVSSREPIGIVEVFDRLGRLRTTLKSNNSDVDLDLSQFQPGIYFIRHNGLFFSPILKI